jgi:hypothetical protein
LEEEAKNSFRVQLLTVRSNSGNLNGLLMNLHVLYFFFFFFFFRQPPNPNGRAAMTVE